MDSNFSTDGVPPSDTPLARQRYYAQKATAAHDAHRFWPMVWFELARDYNAAVANVAAFVRWIDDRPAQKADYELRRTSKNDPP